MPKRKSEQAHSEGPDAANPFRPESARLQQPRDAHDTEEHVRRDTHLLSPSPSHPRIQEHSSKLQSTRESPGHRPAKKARLSKDKLQREPEELEAPISPTQDFSVLHWLETGRLPTKCREADSRVSKQNCGKRKNSSTHHSDGLQRLGENGVHMTSSPLLQKSSEEFCNSLLEGDLVPAHYPSYPQEKVSDVLERVHGLNDFRLQSDVTPWVVPSAENLFSCGESTADWIGEEVQADWTRCATIGGTRPRPDFALGLLLKAFTKDEIAKLRNHSNSDRPFFFTPNLCFPFLTCEAKTGRRGMEIADRQNIHSASITVRAIIRLAEAAFGKDDRRVKELYGKVLAFTVPSISAQYCTDSHSFFLNPIPWVL